MVFVLWEWEGVWSGAGFGYRAGPGVVWGMLEGRREGGACHSSELANFLCRPFQGLEQFFPFRLPPVVCRRWTSSAGCQKLPRTTAVSPSLRRPLGAWACQPRALNEKFVFDRYMGHYCVRSRASTCVVEAVQGTPMRLRHPGMPHCLHYDGKMQALKERVCNATEPKQQWQYDAASMVFRHASDPQRCGRARAETARRSRIRSPRVTPRSAPAQVHRLLCGALVVRRVVVPRRCGRGQPAAAVQVQRGERPLLPALHAG